MPIARFELPDGRIGRFEVPEGTTPDQAMQLISSNLQNLLPKETPANEKAPSVPDQQLVKVPAQPTQEAPEPSLGNPTGDDFASAIANVQKPEYQSVLSGVQLPQENLQGLNPKFVASMQKNLDVMDPDKRQQTIDRLTQQENTVGGRAAKIIADRYKAMDLQPEKAKFATDSRVETQTNRFIDQGANPETARTLAQVQAERGVMRPDLQQLTPDIVGEQADKAVQEQAKELEGAGFLTRVGAEAKSQLAQTGMGLMQNYADLIGDAQMSKDLMGAQRVESEKGANVPTGPSLFEKSAQHAIATLATQAPVMAIGTITGTAAPMLAFAGVQQYGQAYGEGRQAGLDPVAASARAGLQAAAEVMFEQFGMPKSLAGLKTLFKEAPNKKPVTANDVAAYFMNAIAHELPTELATTATQYGIDILPGIGTNKNPSLGGLYEQLAETLRQTIIQSGATAGAAIGATKGTQAAQRQLEKTEFGRNLAVANAIKKDVANAEFTQEGINKDVVARLNPNSYAYAQFAPEEVQRPPLTAANIEKQEAAEKVLQEPKEGDVAPPSNSQDTQAMLDELTGAKKEEVKPNDVAFDATGWEKVERKNLQPGTEVLKKTDDANNTHSVVLRNGTVSQSSTTSPNLAIKNSYLAEDEGDVLNGKIIADNVTGKLSFVPVSGNIIELTPRASEAYKAGIPFEKIAEQEFSDAGGIKPDGTLTPHTTTVEVIKPKKTLEDHVNDFANKIYEHGVKKEPDLQEMNPEDAKSNIKEVLLDSIKEHGGIKKEFFTELADIGIDQKQIDDFNKSIKPLVPAEAPKSEDKKTPKLPPNVEQVASFPMGENTDYHVLKTPTGFVANLFDNDAGKYVNGSARAFPTKTFGEEAETKAKDFAKEQAEKAAKFNEPTEVKKEEQVVPKVEEKLPPEEPKAEEEKPTAAIEPKIKVGKSKLTPAPILEKLAQPAVDGINRSNDLVNQLTESMPTAKDPDAHQKAIDDLNSTADILKDKGQVAVDEMARNNKMTPGEQNRAIQKANAELKKALIEHDKSIKAAKKLITSTKTRVKKTPPPLELTNKTEDELYLEKLNKDLEYAEMARRQVKTTGLFGALKGDLTAADVRDISLEDRFTKLKSKSGGQSLSDIVLSGRLDAYLPNDMRHDAPNFDDKESAEYIKERLRQYNYMTFDAEQELEKITSQIEDLRGNIKELEDQIKQQLELKDVNLLLEEAFNEQREADLADTVIEPEDENRAIEPGKAELALTGQTPDEVRAAERAKEDRLKTEREAEAKAKADEGVGEFTLTGSNRPADTAAAKGQEDLFGQPKVEAKPAEMEALNDKIHDVVEQKSQEFQPGDHASMGSVPGIVLGVEGDYVRFKPDNAKNPKAYQRVPAKTLTFNFRPGAEPKVAASKASDKQTGTEKGKLNADMGGLIKLLGGNLYAANIADVSVKELLQNAFDASKAAVKLGLVKVGKINIVLNQKDRTITVTDNARGMTPSIVKDAFFTVAGSDKSDLDPKERSGGLGLAKMGFMMGSERLKLDTVRDGIRTTVDTDSRAIADSKFDINKTKAPSTEHGTSVTVTIPEKYTDPKTGDQKDIWFPYSKDSIDALKQPLVGPVEVTVDFNGNKETLPVGVNFDDKKMPKLTTVHFSWGDADVYFGVDRKESSGYSNRPNHKVLSSGVYQFRHDFPLSQSEIIPYDILINVKPDVDAKHPDYPFENSRERFKGRIDEDIKSLGEYLKQVARGNEAKDLQENFKGIVSMPRLEVGSEIADASKKLKKAFDTRNAGAENKFELPPVPREIFVSDGFVKTKTGEDLVKPKDNKKESTFTAEKEAPVMADFMVNMSQDPKLPIFHNNTNVDYLEVGRPYGDPEKFFAELGTLLVEMKENLADSGLYSYDVLKPENLFFGGVSIDKKYGGVHIKVPYKGVFVNPFYNFGAKTLAGVRETILNTMIHEIAHTGSMSHGVEHNGEMIKVANYLADSSMMDYYRDALMDILVRNESAFTAMREAYGKSTTQNTSKSFEDYGKSSASKAPGTAQGVGVNQPSVVPTGGQQGSLFPLPGAGQAGQQGQVNQGGGGAPLGRQGNMFPPGPPSKRNVFGGPAPQKTWDLAPETKLGHLINTLDYKIYDKHVDTRQVQAAITKNSGLIDDAFDAYMKEELYHGRTANEIKDFLKNDLSPVVKDLISAKLSIDDLEQYLHNRHAEERNDAIAQINPRFADVDNEPGSGIGTQAAKDYFKNLDPTKAAELAKIAAKVDDIIKGTQKILVDRGLETQATIDNWNQAYKHYIPLMRDQEELDFMHHGVGLGKGFQVKGSASKRAYGSTKSVVDILANIAIQRESAIIRSEKARIGRALYGMALKNPNPDFWLPVNPDAIKNKAALYQELVSMGLPISTAQNFIQEPKTPSIDPLTGQVRYTINAGLRSSPNVFPVRINGKDRYIFFNTKDPKAIRMAQAMSNLDAQTLGGLLGTSAQITRWIASVNTQFNPVFGVINFTRDSFGAAFNLTNTPLAGKQKEVAKHVFPAIFAIMQSERASRKNAAVTGPYVALYDRFRRAGGTTGFRESFAKGNYSGKDTTIIERLWADETQSGAMKKARYVFDLLSDYNDAMENAVRLSVFKVALDMGLGEERAASLGKNVTINFNRKGQASPLLQALYAFFNPAVQGAVLVGKTLNGPAGRKIIAGGLAVGVLQALWMAAAGFDADEPPDYIRDKNFIIPIGNKKYLTLPMPPGYNVVPGVARIATEYILGKNHLISGGKPITDAATQVLGLFLDSFNPLGGGTIAQMLSPTPIDPIVAVTMNKDAFGRPIFKEDTALKPTPGFMRSRENSTQISQWIAEFLNYVSSPPGTHYTKGKISPTADEIDYYAGQIGGGAAREVIKAGELAKSAFTSEPVPSYRIPLAGRFYGDAKSQAAIQDKFYSNITLMNKYGNEIINTQKSGQDPSKYMAAHPEAQLYYAASNFNNVIDEMNKNKKNMLKNKVPLKDIREYEAQKYQIMKTFNDQVSNAQKQR